jgi:hypothetical protein
MWKEIYGEKYPIIRKYCHACSGGDGKRGSLHRHALIERGRSIEGGNL